MGDKQTLGDRVEALLINPEVIPQIDVFHPDGVPRTIIPNSLNTKKSIQIYASITNNESMITPSGAKAALRFTAKNLLVKQELKEENILVLIFLIKLVRRIDLFIHMS